MDFFKKLFGGDKEEKTQAPEQTSSGPSMPAGDMNTQGPSMGGEGMKKEEHEKGHPSGNGGKNVCEFC